MDAHGIKFASRQRCKKAKVLKVGFEPQPDGSEDLRATKTTSWRRTTHSETDSHYIFCSVLRPEAVTTRYKGLSKSLTPVWRSQPSRRPSCGAPSLPPAPACARADRPRFARALTAPAAPYALPLRLSPMPTALWAHPRCEPADALAAPSLGVQGLLPRAPW